MLHAEPASVRSAVMLLSVRWTLLALYPGQSSLFTGTELPHEARLDHRRRQVWINVMVAGMAEKTVEVPLFASHD